MSKLMPIISPKRIALIGASKNLQKSAGRLLINVLKTNYQGDIFLVNHKHKEIIGMPSYASILDIAEPIDLACIITPAQSVAGILRECIAKQVKAVMILCSGFSENGPKGSRLEEEICDIIEGEDIILYGPNTPGFFAYHEQWGISFSPRFEPKQFKAGNVGIISHGGSLARSILDSNDKGVGFSYWLSPGNEIDLSFNDCLEFLIEDERTEIILLVIESFFEEDRFFNLLHRAYEKHKPIIVLSIGTTIETLPAVRFHLGKELKTPFPWEAIKHPGLIKVDSISEMTSLAWLFNYYRRPRGKRTLIFSWTGGASIYLADLCARFQIDLVDLSDSLKQQLREMISIKDYYINPLDITTAVYEDVEILTRSLQIIIDSGEYDNFILLFPFQIDFQNEVLARELVRLMKDDRHLFIPIFLSQGEQDELSLEIVRESGLPYFTNEYTAIKALSMFINFHQEGGQVDAERNQPRSRNRSH